MVLCVAALSEEKDHATLLRAWQVVERERKDAYLVLLGSGKLRTALEALATALDLKGLVWLGDRANVLDFIHGSDLVVLTSQSEGLGSALCEAQAAGKAVVATRAGGIPEAIEDGVTGLLAAPAAIGEIATAILTLLADPARRERLGRAGRLRALRLFDPASTAAAHASVYSAQLPE
jgi:glycosyltransferase involved in cell wall biosynthesis